MVTEEINLQTLTDKAFVGLCHLILLQEHGTVYRPVAEEGGDEGIDGFMEDFSIVYQIKFFRARPRPATFLKDVDKVSNLPGLKRWVLLIPDNPTKKLYQLVAKEKTQRPFDLEVLGKTWILSKLDEYKDIKERFFPEIAKEVSVQKLLTQSEHKAQTQEQLLREIKRKIKSKKSDKPPPERPPDCLSPEHRRDIKDEVKRIERTTKGKYPFGRILAQLKNKYNVDDWYSIKDVFYGEIMAWLNKYYHGVQESPISPSQRRKSLQGVIKAQQKMLGLNDREYSELLSEITGKSSTTQMDITELNRVKFHFNTLMTKM
jgi:hypothetical protein